MAIVSREDQVQVCNVDKESQGNLLRLTERPSVPDISSGRPKLSICIATRNRAKKLAATLDQLVSQATSGCEIVVVDGGATDETDSVVRMYSQVFSGIRYAREAISQGIDCAFDQAVQLATGDYCWLMPDDDLVAPGAIPIVLSKLEQNYSVVLLNFGIVDADNNEVVVERLSSLDHDRIYGPEEMDLLMHDAGIHSTYLGSIVIRRSIWIARERAVYYGSMHAHTAVLFQQRLPGPAVVTAIPLIYHRMGQDHSWRSKTAEMIFKWPLLVDSLAASEDSKKELRDHLMPVKVSLALMQRGCDMMSPGDLRRWRDRRNGFIRGRLIAILVSFIPGVIANSLCILYHSVRREDLGIVTLLRLRKSRFYAGNYCFFREIRS